MLALCLYRPHHSISSPAIFSTYHLSCTHPKTFHSAFADLNITCLDNKVLQQTISMYHHIQSPKCLTKTFVYCLSKEMPIMETHPVLTNTSFNLVHGLLLSQLHPWYGVDIVKNDSFPRMDILSVFFPKNPPSSQFLFNDTVMEFKDVYYGTRLLYNSFDIKIDEATCSPSLATVSSYPFNSKLIFPGGYDMLSEKSGKPIWDDYDSSIDLECDIRKI